MNGVATATMAAKFGYRCTIYMGAEVAPVTAGSRTLKDAIDEQTWERIASRRCDRA